MRQNVFADEVKNHLTQVLIPFWEGLRDEEKGGYYGWLGYDLKLDKEAVKGCILNSRILWFFSNAYLALGDQQLLDDAKHAYLFLRDHCLDRKYGGVFWSLKPDGRPEDTTKHTYNQAFAVYALSSYYDASGDGEVLETARGLSRLIETRCRDEYGYLEAFTRDFRPENNDKLSENGVMAEKTMNTLLHVFESYTELYRVTKNPETGGHLRFMMDLFADRIYNRKLGRQEVFFDRTWNSLIDLYSYGHDIETSWLMDRGLEILGDPEYTAKLNPIITEIAENIYDRAYTGHSLVNEAENGVVDTTRVWWVQAETVVGFLNAWQKTGEKKFLEGAEDVWSYIRDYLVDRRPGSEWYWELDENRNPIEKPIVEPWKCPYHNGRMCLEVMKRMA